MSFESFEGLKSPPLVAENCTVQKAFEPTAFRKTPSTF
jgi:hypothetical protein